MKKLFRLIAIVTTLVAMAACSSDRYEAKLFSVEVPSGFAPDEDADTNFSLFNYVQFTTPSDKSTFVIMAFPFDGNPESLLHNQTLGGANPALTDMRYPTGRLEPFTFGSHSGYEIEMNGSIEGLDVTGTAYSFTEDGCTFFVYDLSTDGRNPELSRKVIESIRVNKEAIASYDDETLVEGVADMARLNIPARIDELTTWSGIRTDHNTKEVVMEMTLEGEASDYEGIGEHLESLRGSMVENLREGRANDWLILVSTEKGYSLGYDYVMTDGTRIASLRVAPEELK